MNERKAKLGGVGRSILRLLRTGSGRAVVDADALCGYALAGSNPLLEGTREEIMLDDALQELSRLDPERSRIVELCYFGGLSIEEISEVEHVSVATVRRRLRMAEAWLHRELKKA